MAEQVPVYEETVTDIANLLAAEEGDAPESQPEQQRAEPEQKAETPEEPEQKAEEKPEEPEDEVVEVQNLHDLAEMLKVDVKDLYGVKLPITNPDGQSEEITLGEYKDAYQSALKVSNQKEQVRAQQAQFEQQQQQAAAIYQQRFQEADQMMQMIGNQIVGDTQNVDWNDLQHNDPAEYASRKLQVQEKLNQVQNMRAGIAQQAQQFNQQQAQQQNQRYQEHLNAQRAELDTKIPEWRDSRVAQAEKAEISSYLSDVPEPAVRAVTDYAALLTMARKAMLYDKQSKAQPQRKRVLRIGSKPITPGASQTKKEAQADDVAKDFAAFRKGNGNIDAAAALIDKHFLGDM